MEHIPSIKYQTFIAASPDKVYRAIATGSGWDDWFTTKATIHLEEMSYDFYWENFGGGRETVSQNGRIIHAEHNRKFGLEWQTAEDGNRTIANFVLTPHGTGTLVELEESGYTWSEKDIRVSLICAGGWGEALTLLKFYLEHGITYGDVPESIDGSKH
ncbi:SRPBCC domain-containing protein [Rubellicoccus peritrichatus]|uniref:SRPBCC domain-containing protein n=1 Tax=Rubellicoccus peritrichatus TaxID=3080537 RepID=A0AAQ3LCW5_9BACT|nr:SRPBCC domain-containing protein [Puniceicoccus sp. CR14]WOO43694.1 SRPBCC domain-containing protein [Puniceicoccus sp. CR14]